MHLSIFGRLLKASRAYFAKLREGPSSFLINLRISWGFLEIDEWEIPDTSKGCP